MCRYKKQVEVLKWDFKLNLHLQILQPLSEHISTWPSLLCNQLPTHTLFLNCASQCLEAGCASAVPQCRGQTSDRGLGSGGRTSSYFKITVRFLRRTQQCNDLSREVLKPSRKTNNIEFRWSDKQPANYSRHVKSVKCSLPNLYSNIVFNSAFPVRFLHLHAVIIACFLFSAVLLLHPLYRPTVSDDWKPCVRLAHLPADCTNDYGLLTGSSSSQQYFHNTALFLYECI